MNNYYRQGEYTQKGRPLLRFGHFRGVPQKYSSHCFVVKKEQRTLIESKTLIRKVLQIPT